MLNGPERIGRIAHQIQKIGFEKKSEIENTLDYVVAYLSKDIEGVLKNLEERTDFPQYVMMDLAFRFGFIVQEGTDEQVVRYIQLGRRADSRRLPLAGRLDPGVYGPGMKQN